MYIDILYTNLLKWQTIKAGQAIKKLIIFFLIQVNLSQLLCMLLIFLD